MAIAVLSQVKKALSNLNSREVRAAAERPVTIGLVGASAESLGRMETYFAPPIFLRNAARRRCDCLCEADPRTAR